MVIESGVIIFAGLLFLAFKLKRSTLLTLLSYPLIVDLGGSALAYVMHYGTFSGVMAAAVAGLMISAMTSGGRWLVGYKANGAYVPGVLNWRRYA